MELTLIAVIGVVSIVAVAVVADKIGVAAPLVLVVVGVALSFLPGLPDIHIDPEVILAGVLPPLLYSSASRMPTTDFRRDIKAIASLAVTLVVLTTVVCGYLFDGLFGHLGLAAAFALGAIISPTDAVAATTVGKKLGLPTRLLTILEGEGLVNDATSLVLLSSAITAITAEVQLWRIGLDFVYAVGVAVAAGIVVGAVGVAIRSWLNDPVLNTAVSFTVPFLAFLPAEALGASGVLSVVLAGLTTGVLGPRYVRAQDRVTESINWRTIAFLLESGIFLFMGLQLKTLLDADSTAGLSSLQAMWIGLLAAAVAIVLRVVFVAPLVVGLRKDADRAASMKPVLAKVQEDPDDPQVQARFGRRSAGKNKDRFLLRVIQKRNDLDFYLDEKLGWRGAVVLGWSGMRGAVTLAAAETLPADAPYRPQLLLVAFTVAITTLLLQGVTLPWVIRTVKVPSDDADADRADVVALVTDMNERVEQLLDAPDLAQSDGTPYAPEILAQVRTDMHVDERRSRNEQPAPDTWRGQYLELTLRVLQVERDVVLDARLKGTRRSRTITRAEQRLDLEEARYQLIGDASRE